MFHRFNDYLARGLEWAVGILCIVLLLCLFVEVLNRYVFFTSWPEIQFIIPFCFLWMIMLGSAIAVRKGQHFEVDLLNRLLGGRTREFHRIAMVLTVIAGGMVILWSSVAFLELGLMKKNSATGIRMIYIYASLLVGGGLIALFGLERLLNGSDDGPHIAAVDTALHEIEEMRK